MKLETAYYELHNYLRIRFSTDNPEFYEFVDDNFQMFKASSFESEVDLEVRVFFSSRPSERPLQRVAHNMLINDHQVCYYDYLDFEVFASGTYPLNIDTYVSSNFLRDFIRFVLRGRKGAKYQKYFWLMRTAVQLPIAYLLKAKGFILLHGSAVARDNSGYLFLGGNGVGKTTIALHLVYNYGFKFVGDDFLPVKDDRVYAFPDKLRVALDTLASLAVKPKGLQISSKCHFALPKSQLAMSTHPVRIFITQTSPKASLDQIDARAALKRIYASHNYLHEFPEYSYLAFLPGAQSVEEIQERYLSFLTNKDIYLLYLSPCYSDNVRLILEEVG